MNGGGGEKAAGSQTTAGAAPAARRCEDCGNQAKRECRYRRCRRCCNRKRFRCQTHVSSTWVPTSVRRIRRLSPPAPAPASQPISTTHHFTADHPPFTFSADPSGSRTGTFPREMRSMATFHCCRVSSTLDGNGDGGKHDDDDDEQYAYRTSVSIGGHVFKGILYDQGLHSVDIDDQRRRQSSTATGILVAPLPLPLPLPFSSYPFPVATSTTSGGEQTFLHSL